MPENLIAVVNPDGTLIGGSGGGGGSVTIDGQPIGTTVTNIPHVVVDSQPSVTIGGQPISTNVANIPHVIVDSQPAVTIGGQPISTNATIVGQPVQVTPLGDSFTTVNAVGSFANPIGGSTIVTVNAPSTGRYKVQVQIVLSGTGVPTTPHNYNLQVAIAPQLRIFVPTVRDVTHVTEYILDATAGQTIRVFATNNEPTGVVATGMINLYRQV